MSVDGLTAERVAAALGRPVDAVSVERIGEAHGFSCELARVALSSGDPGVPATAIAKAPAHEAEVRFYRELAPRTGRNFPRLLGVEPDGFLLLEEVTGRQGDAIAGCDAADAEAVLRALARLHAAWWDDPALGALDWLRRVGARPDEAQARHDERVPRFLEKYGDRVSPDVRRAIETLRPRYGDLLARFSRAPRTLLHGDAHLDNLLFGDDVWILDWEHPACGRAAYDLALFLYASLHPAELSRAHAGLLDAYLDALGMPEIGRDSFERDMMAGLAVVFGATVNGLARLDPEECRPRQRAWIESVLDPGALFLAVEALDPLERLD